MLLRLLHRVLLPCSAAHAARANIGSSCSTRQHDSSCANMTAHAQTWQLMQHAPTWQLMRKHDSSCSTRQHPLFSSSCSTRQHCNLPQCALVLSIHIPRAVSCVFHTHSQSCALVFFIHSPRAVFFLFFPYTFPELHYSLQQSTHTRQYSSTCSPWSHVHFTLFIGLARTVYSHRIWPYLWWFPC